MNQAVNDLAREMIKDFKEQYPYLITIVVLAVALTISLLGVKPLGDVNGDGRVTTTDLAQLRQMAEGLQKPNRRSDVSGNGITNEYDLQMLRIIISGQ